MPEGQDSLFPEMPEDLSALTIAELKAKLAEHEEASKLVMENDADFLAGLSDEEILTQFRAGADQIKAIFAEMDSRTASRSETLEQAQEMMKDAFTVAEATEPAPDDSGDSGDGDDGAVVEEAPVEVVAEAEEVAEEKELVLASAEPEVKPAPPAPASDRQIEIKPQREMLSFVASALIAGTPPGAKLESLESIAAAQSAVAKSLGRPNKSLYGNEERYVVASLDLSPKFPDEWTLNAHDWQENSRKMASHGNPYFGQTSLTAASANVLCAPAENIYDSPRLFTDDRPVAGALPSYAATRGAINVPTPTSMGDAAAAITLIDQASEELGGTFATKACLDMSCPQFTETAVTTIAHCRQFGNLQAMTWPEKIAYENALTMAEWARVAETYLLDRIKALSIAVSSGAETASAVSYFVDFVMKAKFGIRSRLRLPSEARFTVLAPRVLMDIFQVDTSFTVDGNRFTRRGEIDDYLASLGVDITWYIDTPTSAGQIADSAQTAAAVDGFPDTIQLAFFPAGTFTRLVLPEFNLGIVRDSTLNSTNEFEVFGEGFENVARIGPAQAAYWETLDVCANGMLAPAGTARTCD